MSRFPPHIDLKRTSIWLGLALLAVPQLVPPDLLQGIDETVQRMTTFFGLGLLVAGTFRPSTLPVVGLVAIAAASELLLTVSPGRGARGEEFVWNVASALTALTLVWTWWASVRRGAVASVSIVFGAAAVWLLDVPDGLATGWTSARVPLHYTVNHAKDFPDAAAIGFNLADVSSVGALDLLPDGAKGVLWLRNGYNLKCVWQRPDEEVVEIVQKARDHPKFSGIYFISDTPHPSICPDGPQRIAERTALIHKHDPNGRSFIAVSGGHKFPEEFAQLADAADLIGVVVYPCNSRIGKCQPDKINERVGRAFDAGIPKERLVPVLQAFGQACTTNENPYYQLPTVEDMHEILRVWDELLPPEFRPFDMTYSWGGQERHACPNLTMADGVDYPDLQAVYSDYFKNMKQ
ncbi:hypothetical protein [Pseudoruegeria sp. SK021]|uniref:hypothetical protein n=1 Tax=Pseudoruegeria sp. SK021 TaxID=1933035 RepID=UPI000A243013|nr:hypothetical protein [Pseudoruegeria sp. SK021]OSP53626.1 hypothetical protein BV911_16950 [Pseudoruegeria sp. SK021]